MHLFIQRSALGVASRTGVTSYPESLSPFILPNSTSTNPSTRHLPLLSLRFPSSLAFPGL